MSHTVQVGGSSAGEGDRATGAGQSSWVLVRGPGPQQVPGQSRGQMTVCQCACHLQEAMLHPESTGEPGEYFKQGNDMVEVVF